MKRDSRGHAIVSGGSLAGLFCAQVLADCFEKVTVIDRDWPGVEASPRKGAPQGAHAHVLLKRGQNAVETLFPGMGEELIQHGAHPTDFAEGVAWYHFGCWKLRGDSKLPTLFQSRPLLEGRVRARLLARPNVVFRNGTRVEGLVIEQQRITGLRVQGAEGPETINGDLVIDASGRASKLPLWLEQAGFPAPAETKIDIGLGYVSRVYQAPDPDQSDWKTLILYPYAPHQSNLGGIFKMENKRWMVTLGGYGGNKLPTDPEGFLQYARQLPDPTLYEAIRQATPLTDATVFRYDIERRRHYESIARLPQGLLAIGDAVCSFDPVFGQGMSVAAAEALILKKCLQKKGNTAALPALYFRRIARLIDVPWLLVTNEGFRYPTTRGKKPLGLGLLQWYTAQVFKLSATNQGIYNSFLKVMHLLASPALLFRPGVLFPVLLHSLKGLLPASEPARESTSRV